MLDKIRLSAEKLITQWQVALGDEVEVLLGGSLVSGLLIVDEETEVIDLDVRFLVDDPSDQDLLHRIETCTGLHYRKTIVVDDWPDGQSTGNMVEGVLSIDDLPYPFEVEGCIRNRKYVGWHRFYSEVLSREELEACRVLKVALRHNKQAYKMLKFSMILEVRRRCLMSGLVK